MRSSYLHSHYSTPRVLAYDFSSPSSVGYLLVNLNSFESEIVDLDKADKNLNTLGNTIKKDVYVRFKRLQ